MDLASRSRQMVEVEVHKSWAGGVRTDEPDLNQAHWGSLGLDDDSDPGRRIGGSQYH
jgi:hypothetical protein